MSGPTPSIDSYLFEQHYAHFVKHVEQASGVTFTSFSANPFTDDEESYKYDLHRDGRRLLSVSTWREADIGSGKIARAVVTAVEQQQNNLFWWQPRKGADSRVHRKLLSALGSVDSLAAFETAFFVLYRGNEDKQALTDLTSLFGRQYGLIAFLFFLKDWSRYMPIATTAFDEGFELLGASFATTGRCSWQNYTTYNSLLTEVQFFLNEKLGGDVSLLDAHSFVWMLVKTVKGDVPPGVDTYKTLPAKDREAVRKARIGQGPYRNKLLNYWGGCSVTGCKTQDLLVASHAKPWADCKPGEAVDMFNGLLLTPTLDRAFDRGYITFDDLGKIIVSGELNDEDATVLDIRNDMHLRRFESAHRPFLDHHRVFVFKG